MSHADAADRRVAGAVDAFWVAERPGPSPEEWVLPTGRGQIVINLGDHTGQLIGPRTKSARVSVAEVTAGISLTGIGTYCILGSDVADVVDTSIDLKSIAPGWTHHFGAKQADRRHGLRRLAQQLLRWDVDETIAAIEATIRGGRTAATALEHAGVDRRRFVAAFRSVVGTSPKQYERYHRFETAVKALRRPDEGTIAATAVRLGYYDQAHLATDIRALGGCPPSELRRLVDDGRPNHIPAADRRRP